MIAGGLLVLSCKKKRAYNEDDAQDTVDARFVQAECDEVVKDVNTVIMEQFLLRGKTGSAEAKPGKPSTSICGVLLDTSQVTSGIMSINYTGANCFGRIRTGSVRFSIRDYPLKKWKNQGAVITIEYLSYRLQRVSDGKTITLTGTQTLTNESGGTWYELWYLNQPNVVYHLVGEGLKIGFDQVDVAKFSMDRRMTYTYAAPNTACSVSGNGTADGHGSLENWGYNRKGDKFYSEVKRPYVWKTQCGSVAPVEGEVEIILDGKAHTLNSFYGVDKDGNDVSGSTNPCPFGWKVTLKYKKKSRYLTFSYY
jgi:hypothetical protein